MNMLQLNRECDCFPIARSQVDKAVLSLTDNKQMKYLLSDRAHYFASTPVFLSRQTINAMTEQISDIERTLKTPEFQSAIFDHSALAAFAPARSTQGAFMGYDFHITEDGPKLIEINSNAGGAFIVNAIRKAIDQPYGETEQAIADMFQKEWNLSGRSGELKTIAIVDETPNDQFHYPDMLLAASLLERHGLNVIITDRKELRYEKSGLYVGETKIDLIYNRLTDFELSAAHLSDLKQAWLDEAVVVTPDPRHHALHADKRNLIKLSQILPAIPQTLELNANTADQLWAARKDYYFKPFAGFGSRAVYRGSKLTHSKWAEISKGGYIAQKLVKPPLRLLGGGQAELKFDVRVYTYAGKPLLMAARVYQGQVTNLRTEGGGLAPIIEIADPITTCSRASD